MYISKYWGNYIGGTDDSLTLISYLTDKKKDKISLCEIFADTGLYKQNGSFQQTSSLLEYACSNGYKMEFYYAIDLITDIAALLLECKVSGSVNLNELNNCHLTKQIIQITATPEEHELINKALADFSANPISYDLSEMVSEEDIHEMGKICEKLRKELYK